MFYLMMHSIHFIDCYMELDICHLYHWAHGAVLHQIDDTGGSVSHSSQYSTTGVTKM